MTFNSKDELMDDSLGPLVITYTANTQTAALTQTIADGAAMTDAEVGQAFANVFAVLNDLVATSNA